MMLGTFSKWPQRRVGRWPAAVAWTVAWIAMLALDGRVDLANLAMSGVVEFFRLPDNEVVELGTRVQL